MAPKGHIKVLCLMFGDHSISCLDTRHQTTNLQSGKSLLQRLLLQATQRTKREERIAKIRLLITIYK